MIHDPYLPASHVTVIWMACKYWIHYFSSHVGFFLEMVVFNLNIKTGWLMHLDALGNLWGAQLRSDEEGWWMLDPMGDWGTTRCCGDHRMHKIAKKKKNNFMNITNCELFVCQKLQVICYYHHLQLLHLQEWKIALKGYKNDFPCWAPWIRCTVEGGVMMPWGSEVGWEPGIMDV